MTSVRAFYCALLATLLPSTPTAHPLYAAPLDNIGNAECHDGYEPITTIDECTMTSFLTLVPPVDPGNRYEMDTSSSSSEPKYCSVHYSGGFEEYYFNYHPVGGASASSIPICRKSPVASCTAKAKSAWTTLQCIHNCNTLGKCSGTYIKETSSFESDCGKYCNKDCQCTSPAHCQDNHLWVAMKPTKFRGMGCESLQQYNTTEYNARKLRRYCKKIQGKSRLNGFLNRNGRLKKAKAACPKQCGQCSGRWALV